MEYSSLETFFDIRGITNKEKYLITRVKKSFKGYRTGYRGYSKKIWINNLAEYYKQKGYQVSGHGDTVIKKILDVTGLHYPNILNWLDQKYKQSLDRLNFNSIEIIEDYQKINNLTSVAEKHGTDTTTMGNFLRANGIEVTSRPRHQFKIEPIKKPDKLSFLGAGTAFILKASWCDYLFKHQFNMDCTIIEEKQTLSQFNYGQAISQLIVGQKIVEEKTNYTVVRKIILCNKISDDVKKRDRLKHIILDIRKYLGITVVDLSKNLTPEE